MSEIERVAQAICLWDGMEWDGPLGGRECSRKRYRDMANAAIAALDALRAEEKRKNCKHHSRTGTGCLGSDGSGWNTWFCQECGASYDSRAQSPAVRNTELEIEAVSDLFPRT